MEENKNVPKIRFKGYCSDWKSLKFDKVFVTLSSNTLSRSELNYENGSTKNIHYGDVLIKFGECLDVANEIIPYISNEEISEKYSASRLQEGDIIFADTAEDATAGKCTELLNVHENRIISGLHTIPCHPLFSFAKGYLGYFLNSPAFHNQLISLMQGTKVIGISKSAIKDTNIVLPKTEEQSKIGNYFQNIDKLINTSQIRLDKLKIIKVACLEKMFPKKGSNVPEIRFNGFTKEWEEKRLGDLGEFKSSGVDKKSNINELPVNLLNYMDVFTNRKVTAVTCVTLMQITAKKNQIKDNDIQKNDIFFTPSSETSDDIARVMVVEETLPNTVYSYHLIRYRPKEKCFSSIFPNYGFSCDFVRKQMILAAQGVQRFVIKRSGFEELMVMLPLFDEQTKIGDYFKNLDDIINKTEQQLHKLKNIKKACIEKMFVNTEDTI